MATSRKTARNALVALITANMMGAGQLNAVYDHLPKDFAGKSPVCSVESWNSFVQWLPEEINEMSFRVVVSVRRDEDAGAAEDLLDDLAEDFANLIEGWDNAVFARASESEYEMIDSIQYKSEAFFVMLDWQG